MKKLYLPLFTAIIVLLASNIYAVEITYNVASGGNTTSLTTDYDLSAGSRADSQIDITSNPSISSHTTINAQGDENNIEITTEANDGAGSTSNASVRIFDNVETATVTTNANASNSTSASVNAAGTGATAGIIKGESDGTKKFCAFTGDFTASSDTGRGNVAIASSYTIPKANIFIVSKDPIPCHNPVYPDIQPAVDDASKAGGLPDQGGYTGADIAGKNNLTLTGVWGADNTAINGTGGDTLYVHDSDNFTVEGFTVTGGTNTSFPLCEDGKRGDGISIYTSDNAQVTGNTANDNKRHGIVIDDSSNARIEGNTANDNDKHGIFIDGSSGARIEGNTAHDNVNHGIYVSGSSDARIEGNTANDNGIHGIHVYSSDSVNVTDNTVSSNAVTGVMISHSSSSVTVNQNNIFGNLVHGLNNNTGNNVNATNNWWGSGGTGGPGEGGNNDVVGNVDSSGWSKVKF